MAIDALSKSKILGHLNKNAVSDLFYEDFYIVLSTKKKVTDIDFLTFFVDYISDVLSNKKEISLKLLEKLLQANCIFLAACLKDNLDIDAGLIAKMRMYNEGCNSLGIEDKNIDDLVKRVNIFLNKKYECDEDKSVSMYVSKIQELEKKLLELTSSNSMKEKEISNLLEQLKETEKAKSKIAEKLESNNTELSNLKKEVKRLNDVDSTLSDTLEVLKEEKSNNLELTREVEELKTQIDEQDSILVRFNEEKECNLKQEFLYKAILELVLKEKLSFKELCLKLKNKYKEYNFEENEILSALTKVGKRFNIIDSEVLTIPKVYGICPPKVSTLKKLMLETKEDSCMDIMLVADLHIKKLDKTFIKNMDEVYNYCTENSIFTILDLGDFLDGKDFDVNKENLETNISLLEDIITHFPKAPNIQHVVLGGNHDKENLVFGIDPIRFISSEREDIIDLGYDHAFICFINNNEEKDFIMLHHKGLPIEHDINDYIEKSAKINERILSFYEGLDRNRKDCYIDIFAHLHKSRLDTINNYCIVPSLLKKSPNYNNGAWHVKIYFDENSKIKYMIFMPLLLNNNKLYVTSEQVYQKILK